MRSWEMATLKHRTICTAEALVIIRYWIRLNYAPNDLAAFRGKLLFKTTYNNRYHKVAEEEYHYNVENKTADYEVSINTSTGVFLASKIFTVPCLLIQEKLTDENGVAILHNYEYNANGFVTEKETVNSNGIMCI